MPLLLMLVLMLVLQLQLLFVDIVSISWRGCQRAVLFAMNQMTMPSEAVTVRLQYRH